MPPEIDYGKFINEMLDDDRYNINIPDSVETIMKTFMLIPGISDVFNTAIRNASKVNNGKMDLKKFYMKVRKLFIEMSEYYKFGRGFILPNENIWNPDCPQDCLPSEMGLFDMDDVDASKEWANIHGIVNRVITDLSKLTVEDFQYLNKLHKKYKRLED